MSDMNTQRYIDHKDCFNKPTIDPEKELAPARPTLVTGSPTPNPVRRITPTPFFSTADPSLSCIFRLPYEIRRQILRYLLWRPGGPVYLVCVATQRLLLTKHFAQHGNFPHYRHGFAPEILRCSRACEEEGARVLYGENGFSVVRHDRAEGYGWEIVNSWSLPLRYAGLITKLWFQILNQEDEGEILLARQRYLFPRLQHLTLEVSLTCQQFENLLDMYNLLFRELWTLKFTFSMDDEELERFGEEICWGGKNVNEMDEEDMEQVVCETYKRALVKHSWFNKKLIAWEIDDGGTDHRLNWKLLVDLRW